MDLFLAISTGIGVSLACGVHPFAAALVVAVVARLGIGLDLDDSGWEFLQSIAVIVGAAVLTVVAMLLASKRSIRAVAAIYALIAATVGALEFGGVMAAEGHEPIIGIVAGAVCAMIGLVAAGAFVGGARARLAARGQQDAGSVLTAGEYLAVIVTVVLAIVIPPFSYVPLLFCLWVLISSRRRAGKKYEGLRVLR